MGIDSPVYRAVEKVVELFDLQPDVTVYSYKEEEHFNSLWSLIQNKEAFSKLSTIIIAWEGIPSRKNTDLVNTSKYLTPIDWAVALSLAINDSVRDAHHPYPDLKILILDIGQSSTESDSIKFIDQFPQRNIKHLPWIRMFTPESEGDLRDLDDFFLSLIGVDHKDTKMPSMKEAFDKEMRDLDVIKNIWASFLTRPSTPGDHHSLSNLVGPLLLIEDKGDLHVTALQNFMRAVSLLPEKTTSLLTKQNPWVDINKYDLSALEIRRKNTEKLNDNQRVYEIAKKYRMPIKYILKFLDGMGIMKTHSSPLSGEILQQVIHFLSKKLTIILIDDMVNSGWGKMLCWALGLEFEPEDYFNIIGKSNDIIIKGFNSPIFLTEKLKKLDENNKDQRFKFSIDGNTYSPEILFLDLRLFSGKDIYEEADYFKSLIPLAKKFLSDDNKDLPWQGFSKDEIGVVEAWIKSKDKKREDDGYITALTFLPRILALTDLSLPIILFSSTGRRDISEKLKHYGNIITVFDKPRFTVDIADDISEQTANKFEAAIKKAILILEGRKICTKVKVLGEEARNLLSQQPLVPHRELTPEFSHVEIYLDERGTAGAEPFSIGGFIVGYPDYSTIKDLEEALINEGIYWHISKGNHPLTKEILGSTYFSINDFSDDGIETFCKEILVDIQSKDVAIKSQGNTIEWINELLEINDLYDKCFSDMGDQFTKDVSYIVKKTFMYRSLPHNKIKGTQKDNILRLNRLLLEEKYATTPKGKNSQAQAKHIIETFLKICNSKNVFLSAIKLTDPLLDYYEAPNKRHFPVKDTLSDSIYIRTLTNLIEIALYELLPNYTANIRTNLTVSIFAGTRVLPLVLRNSLKSTETPTDYYGFESVDESKGLYRVISENSFVSIMANLLNARNDMPDNITVHHARGVKLAYGNDFKYWPGTRTIHYTADLLLRKEEYFSNIFLHGFNETSDIDLYKLLDAQREMLIGNDAVAIQKTAMCSAANNKIHAHLMAKVSSLVNDINGNTFIGVCIQDYEDVYQKDQHMRDIITLQRKEHRTGRIYFKNIRTHRPVLVPSDELVKIGKTFNTIYMNEYYYADISRDQRDWVASNLQKVSRD